MFNYIKGNVTVIRGDYIVLENSGIGYQIRVPNPFSLKLNEDYKIYTYLHIRDDIRDLYGFITIQERDLFLKLISVKGIGPKGAIAIIASDSIDKVINAIESKNAKYLQRFPGIGPKASQQIVLDLYGKVNFNDNQESNDPKVSIIQDALKSMGYNTSEIKRVNKVILDNLEKDNNEILKLVLKNLI
ncbi:MAG: Holliday junction branch migration protein RuvA [Bacilli bacterium]